MKLEKWLTSLEGAALAFLISFGAAGCLVTGFDLSASLLTLALWCGCASVLSALCFRFRHGGVVLLCLLAAACGLLWKDGRAAEQLLALLQRISRLYDNAYGWGELYFGVEAEGADFSAAIIGCLVAIAAARTVCRGQWAWPAMLIGLLPLIACVVVIDTVPDEIYLYFLILGLVLLCLTSAVRQRSSREGLRLTAFAAVPAALVLGGLFLLVPQKSYVNHAAKLGEDILRWVQNVPTQMEEITSDAITGDPLPIQPRTERLDTLGNRLSVAYPVMDVTAAESGILYLRGQDFDTYDGLRWTASKDRTEDFPLDDYRVLFIGDRVGDVTISTRAEKNVLYLPYYTQPYTQLTGGRVENEEGLTDYTFTQRCLPPDWKDVVSSLALQQELSGDVKTDGYRYTALPLVAWEGAKAIADSILRDETTATAKAETIARYVKNSAKYDLSPGKMPENEQDFALWFLEDSDKGYCVHFATAAAVLLRAAGVEARYVTGYMAQAEAGQTVTITGDQAHAWVEYYEPLLGIWIPLEATPAGAGTPIDIPEQTDPKIETVPGESEPPETRPGPAQQPGKPQTPQKPQQEEPEKTLPGWLKGIGWGFVCLLAVMGQWLARLGIRRKRLRSGKPNRRALALWQEDVLLSRLLHKEPSRELEDLACKAKFSQHTLSEEELEQFRRDLAEVRRQLHEKPWYLQLVYRFVYAVY